MNKEEAIRKEVFTPSEMEDLKKYHIKSLVNVLVEEFDSTIPTYDFGCGDGWYLGQLQQQGFREEHLTGFEGCRDLSKVQCCFNPSRIVSPIDVASQIYFGAEPGNVMSIEVAEHIHESRLDTFLDNLTRHCSHKLVLSWAVRGQAGNRHISCRNQEEVVPMLEAQGFTFDGKATTWARLHVVKECAYMGKSLYIFNKR